MRTAFDKMDARAPRIDKAKVMRQRVAANLGQTFPRVLLPSARAPTTTKFNGSAASPAAA